MRNIFKPKTHAEQLRKLFFGNLDEIYNTAKAICKKWDKQTIPLLTLEEIISRSQPKVNGIDEKEILVSIMAYNKTLDSLYNSCKMIAKKMDSKSVPLSQLKIGIDLIKKSFDQGVKE